MFLLLVCAACSVATDLPSPASTATASALQQSPVASVQLPPEAGNPTGPSATAGNGSQASYDAVGIASWYGEELNGNRTASGDPFVPTAITAAHRELPLNSVAEVTSLDSGRTILVLINDRGPHRADREIDLSRGAAQLLGVTGKSLPAVRVRSMVANPADLAALRAGKPASERLDTPAVVLIALRRELPRSAVPVAIQAPARARARSVPSPRTTEATEPMIKLPPFRTRATNLPGLMVQVAAFSSESRARALAKTLGGTAQQSGDVWRVRLGPFADRPAAQRARDGAVKRGYGDAAIIVMP